MPYLAKISQLKEHYSNVTIAYSHRKKKVLLPQHTVY